MDKFYLVISDVLAKRNGNPYNVENEESVDGKIVVITGGNSGIGKAAALEIAKRGAHVIIACPESERELSQNVMEEIKTASKNSKVAIVDLGLGDLDSVRKCVGTIREKCPHINILINNAGVAFADSTKRVTKDGFEIHMGVNHLGHVLLTMLLLDLLQKGSPSRIVATASSGFQLAELDMEDFMLEKRGIFGPLDIGPYCNSKLAIIYFMRHLAKKLGGSGVTTYSLCPGMVSTGLMRNVTSFFRRVLLQTLLYFATSPEKGAETILHCALSKTCAGETGLLHRYNSVWQEANEKLNANPEMDDKVWDVSLKLVGIKEP